jgi:hypothetical protein
MDSTDQESSSKQEDFSKQITVEMLLSSEYFVEDIKNYSVSIFSKVITAEIVKKLISFVIVELSDEQFHLILQEKNVSIEDEKANEFFDIYGKIFPFRSSEILSSENSVIIDFLFDSSDQIDHFEELDDCPTQNSLQNHNSKKENNPELLDYFFSFLDNNEELNCVLCGYFVKIFNRIYLSRNDQVLSPLI